jgi:hypothetical protein
MIVKEWTVDEQGRLRVSWVKQEHTSPFAYVATVQAAARTSDSVSPADGEKTEIRNSNGSSKSGKWNWFHTALRTFLP